MRTDAVEGAGLDYLYRFFLDERAYRAAVEAAMPPADARRKIEKELTAAEKALTRTDNEIHNLATAVASGADVSLLLDVQSELKARKETEAARVDDLRGKLVTMPDTEQTKRAAMVTRLMLLEEHQGKDWRTLSYDEIRRFLHSLFGDNPRKQGYGIFITKDAMGRVTATFKGAVNFDHIMSNRRPLSRAFIAAVDAWNAQVERQQDRKYQAADAEYRRSQKTLEDFGPTAAMAESLDGESFKSLEPLYANWWA